MKGCVQLIPDLGTGNKKAFFQHFQTNVAGLFVPVIRDDNTEWTTHSSAGTSEVKAFVSKLSRNLIEDFGSYSRELNWITCSHDRCVKIKMPFLFMNSALFNSVHRAGCPLPMEPALFVFQTGTT